MVLCWRGFLIVSRNLQGWSVRGLRAGCYRLFWLLFYNFSAWCHCAFFRLPWPCSTGYPLFSCSFYKYLLHLYISNHHIAGIGLLAHRYNSYEGFLFPWMVPPPQFICACSLGLMSFPPQLPPKFRIVFLQFLSASPYWFPVCHITVCNTFQEFQLFN